MVNIILPDKVQGVDFFINKNMFGEDVKYYAIIEIRSVECDSVKHESKITIHKEDFISLYNEVLTTLKKYE